MNNFTEKTSHKWTVCGETFQIKFKLWELKCILYPNSNGKQNLILNMLIIIIISYFFYLKGFLLDLTCILCVLSLLFCSFSSFVVFSKAQAGWHIWVFHKMSGGDLLLSGLVLKVQVLKFSNSSKAHQLVSLTQW